MDKLDATILNRICVDDVDHLRTVMSAGGLDISAALCHGAESLAPRCVAALLERGASPDGSVEQGRPLLLAAKAGWSDGRAQRICELLFTAGADVNVHNQFGFTALVFPEALCWFLERARPIADVGTNSTVLHYWRDHANILARVLTYPQVVAVVNNLDKFGRSPLHIVDRLEGAEQLLHHGADPLLTDSSGRTPLQVAQQQLDRHTGYLLNHTGGEWLRDDAIKCMGLTKLLRAATAWHRRRHLVAVFAALATDTSMH